MFYPSLERDGFGAPVVRAKPDGDERSGPQLVHRNAHRAIFYADMTGDGLPDIVRVQNGRVVYWPNLGHGRFGRMVEMAGAPVFDRPEAFSVDRVHLGDVDGSGTSDVIYTGGAGARLWFNQAGNGFSAPVGLPQVPLVDSLSNLDVTDLLGKGTAALVWSTALPARQGVHVAYVDLMPRASRISCAPCATTWACRRR